MMRIGLKGKIEEGQVPLLESTEGRVIPLAGGNEQGGQNDNDEVSERDEMDSETLQQIYVPKWNVINDYALDDPEVCRSMIDQLAPLEFFSQLRGMDCDQLFVEFNVGAARQTYLSAEVSVAEATEAARVSELNSLKERNSVLEEEKGVIVWLSFEELSIRASSLESQKGGLTDQVSSLETACSVLRTQVSGYKLFKEQIEGMFRNEQVKAEVDSLAVAFSLAFLKESEKGGLAEVVAYDPSVEERCVSAGPSVKIQRSSVTNMRMSSLYCHPPEGLDNVFFGGRNFFIGSLIVSPIDRVQKVTECDLSHRLSISEAKGLLVDPLSSENLIGEAQ
ncbi:hypothetical protein Tco_0039592 [Tanacetum coccineum]